MIPRPRAAEVLDLDPVVAEVADQSAEVRIRIVDLAEAFHDVAVVQAEAVKFSIRGTSLQPAQDPVVQACARRTSTSSRALLLDPHDDLVALFPPRRTPGSGPAGPAGRRQYCITASPGLEQPVEGRADMAEVARVDDHLDTLVVRADPRRISTVRSLEALSMKRWRYVVGLGSRHPPSRGATRPP